MSSSSKLAKSLQELICLIFDVDQMKKAMMEFEVYMHYDIWYYVLLLKRTLIAQFLEFWTGN